LRRHIKDMKRRREEDLNRLQADRAMLQQFQVGPT
jgi:hypothetical protein